MCSDIKVNSKSYKTTTIKSKIIRIYLTLELGTALQFIFIIPLKTEGLNNKLVELLPKT